MYSCTLFFFQCWIYFFLFRLISCLSLFLLVLLLSLLLLLWFLLYYYVYVQLFFSIISSSSFFLSLLCMSSFLFFFSFFLFSPPCSLPTCDEEPPDVVDWLLVNYQKIMSNDWHIKLKNRLTHLFIVGLSVRILT